MVWAFDPASSALVVFGCVSVIQFSVVVLFGRTDCSVVWLLVSRSFVKSFGRCAWDLAVVHSFGRSGIRSFRYSVVCCLVVRLIGGHFRGCFSLVLLLNKFFPLRALSLNTLIKTQRETFLRM